MQNEAIPELYTDDKNRNSLVTLMTFLSQLKAPMKSFIQKRQHLKLPLLNFLVKSLTGRKSQKKKTISPLRGKHFSKESYKIYKFSNKY